MDSNAVSEYNSRKERARRGFQPLRRKFAA